MLFAEKVLLALVVPLIVLILGNPVTFDLQQRISGIIALLAVGYFLAHSLQKRTETQNVSPPSVQSTPAPGATSVSGPAVTSGPDSPAVSGSGNTITYGPREAKKTRKTDTKKR